jgi:hypothetical protein
LIYSLRKDLKNAKKVDAIFFELREPKILRSFIKFLNHDEVKMILIVDKKGFTPLAKLQIYQNLDLKTFSGLQNSTIELNFIIIDNSILYIFSTSLTYEKINKSYGVAVKYRSKKMLDRFNRIFKTISYRHSEVQKNY